MYPIVLCGIKVLYYIRQHSIKGFQSINQYWWFFVGGFFFGLTELFFIHKQTETFTNKLKLLQAIKTVC